MVNLIVETSVLYERALRIFIVQGGLLLASHRSVGHVQHRAFLEMSFLRAAFIRLRYGYYYLIYMTALLDI